MKKMITLFLVLALAALMLPGAGAEENTEWTAAVKALVLDTARAEEGTAGASLKEAGLAARWLDLSALLGLSKIDESAEAALRAAVGEALSSCTDEERTSAQNHFQAQDNLIRSALSGDAGTLAQFDDAGVLEGVRKIARQPEALQDWFSFSFAMNVALGCTDSFGRAADPFIQLTGPVSLAGSWQDLVSQRAGMDVTANADGSYDILVYWSSSVSEFSEWKIHGTYDEYTGALFYSDGQYAVVTSDDHGEGGLSGQAVTQGVFLKEGSRLRWIDSLNDQYIAVFERFTNE